MLKKLFVLGLAIFPLLITAQVNINAQKPPAGMVQKEQLWNLILESNKEDVINAKVKIRLQDQATGQIVLSATGGHLLLERGVKAISFNDVQPIVYSYNVPNFSSMYLPVGTYTACYQLLLNGSESDPITEQCIQISVDPISPPILNTPFDQDELQMPYPLFTWIAPKNSQMFNNLSYDLIISEILQDQTPSEAIQNNVPVYRKDNIGGLSEDYLSTNTAFEADKLYGWQIVVKNAIGNEAKSDVWTFKLKKPDE